MKPGAIGQVISCGVPGNDVHPLAWLATNDHCFLRVMSVQYMQPCGGSRICPACWQVIEDLFLCHLFELLPTYSLLNEVRCLFLLRASFRANVFVMKRRDFLVGGALLATSGALRAAEGNMSEESSLKVAFFTDVHAREGSEVERQLELAGEQINSWNADIVIGGGDYIHGGFNSAEEQMRPRWEIGRKFLDSLNGRIELIAGNHDLVGAGLGVSDPYRVARDELGIPSCPRRFTVGDFTFFCLDSIRIDPANQPSGYRGEVSALQLSWLDRELAKIDSEAPLVLMTHIPFRTTFLQAGADPLSAASASLIVAGANTVLRRFAKHNLIGVLQGHLHLDEQLIVNGQSFITGGAVCGAWWKGPNLGTYRGSGTIAFQRGTPDWKYYSYRQA